MHHTHPSTSAALIALILASLASSAATAQEVTYVVEPTHSFVYFEVVHYKTSTVRGRFDKTEGTIKVNREARTGSADITVHTTAINTGIPAFDGMLKSDKFFDAANHPQAQFKATGFTFGSDASVQAVQGQLTLRGQTKPVSLKASHFNCYQHPVLQREICGGDFSANINRRDWGISSYDVIPDDVRIVIQLETIRQ